MSLKERAINFWTENGLNLRVFADRVRAQVFIRDNKEDAWAENPRFAHGGLYRNHMTGYGIGFAYYDCTGSTDFCRHHCYGLRLSGPYSFNMLRLGCLSSESLKTADPRFLGPLYSTVKTLPCLKIGHWGDAVPEQIPVIGELVKDHPKTVFWWYTRKTAVATAANTLGLPNLRTYLSLDPMTACPDRSQYPFGLTYCFGDGQVHPQHEEILADERLVAVFPLKKGCTIEDPADPALLDHPRLCREKLMSIAGAKAEHVCLSCTGRCRYDHSTLQRPPAGP